MAPFGRLRLRALIGSSRLVRDATRRFGLVYAIEACCKLLAGILVCGIIDKTMRARQRNPKRLPLPPGPKGLPILGSAFEMPRDRPRFVYDDWCKIYGALMPTTLSNQ